ncbi:Serine/threonine-protein kinase Sgk1 [Tolypocladium ophioglossoides CBS 100239]|uniref:EKC/KEOPS complex subunit BUD32 n=1 Tax=Tolypocladium ophioglossoides (strain CBS 100239) TaxID=1163406 RepID=A0A0L0N8L0_TOLOC|nr:Serine/threonine-protein kinase Sgk1 [Tolypocladium ophioglossoides CBS 100239]
MTGGRVASIDKINILNVFLQTLLSQSDDEQPISNPLLLSQATDSMCKELVPSTKFRCKHVLDQPSYLIEWDDCKNCGEIKAGPDFLGRTTKRDPCEDCKENGTWKQDEVLLHRKAVGVESTNPPKDFRNLTSALSYNSLSFEQQASDIVRPPRSITSRTFVSLGATSWVYQVAEGIVLKYPWTGKDDLATENAIYDILESHAPCPFAMQSFLRLPNAIFLPLFSGGTFRQRLENNQLLGPRNKFIEVLRLEPLPVVERWAMELSGAVAWLESLGLVHGDLRPENLLLSADDHLMLTDFDCVEEIGTLANGNAPPWARLLPPEPGEKLTSWGVNGPQTEQFAVGSLLYCMTRGCEPYQREELERDLDVVKLLMHMKFPELGEGSLDGIIDRCWNGRYASLQLLAAETEGLAGAMELPRATVLESSYIAEQRRRCQRLVDEGLLGSSVI